MRGKFVWYVAAIVATIIMATLGVFVRQVSSGNEFTIVLGRFGVGVVCLATLRALKGEPNGGKRIRVSWALAASGIVMPLFVICYIKAVLSGTLANAAFLLYLGPLIASSLAAIWLGEVFTRIGGLLLTIALLGTLFITEFKFPEDADQLESLIFGLLSGLFYGLFLLFNNRKLQGDDGGFTTPMIQFLFAVLVTLPIVFVTGINLILADLFWLTAIGVIHGFGALTLVIMALKHLKTIEYSTISYGEPVAAALIGGIAYHEKMSILQLVGCLFVLAAGMARVFIREGRGSRD
jgi:drug/metabolite transporter (DMT)-like permease